MKFLIILTFCLAAATASPYLRNVEMPTIEDDGRITNGQTASSPEQFPYQVGLSLRANDGSQFWCGGSLIGSTWVLTAAHCTDGKSSVTVYLGATVRASAKTIRTVSKQDIIIHPDWNPRTVRNDISLIRIVPVDFSSNIQPVRIPAISSSYPTYVGEYGIATGWGRTSDLATGGTLFLQYARLQIINNRSCARIYAGHQSSTMICVATPNAVSTCSGDSGGPLVLENTKVQVGLTSYGSTAGCERGYPVVFTRLTSYLDWIKSHTGISY